MNLITIIVISVSIAFVCVVIASFVWLNRKVTRQHHIADDSVEISAVVSEFNQRLKRLEEALVDQKVKMEIWELRSQRSLNGRRLVQVEAPMQTDPKEISQQVSRENEVPLSLRIATSVVKRAGSMERDVLRLVIEGRGKMTAKEIQARIGRTREHTARMMNGLFREGLVERDSSVRPFSYSITEKGREFMSG